MYKTAEFIADPYEFTNENAFFNYKFDAETVSAFTVLALATGIDNTVNTSHVNVYELFQEGLDSGSKVWVKVESAQLSTSSTVRIAIPQAFSEHYMIEVYGGTRTPNEGSSVAVKLVRHYH